VKLRAGAYYRTRDGRKAYVSCVLEPSPFGGKPYVMPVCGWIEGRGIPKGWPLDGREAPPAESMEDLVDEWREPRVLERHLMFYEVPDSEVVFCAQCVKPPVLDIPGKVLARVAVRVTEGEGL
jgi:hypothetical protein